MHFIVSPRVRQEELHIWWANLRDFDLAIPALKSVLSPSEQAKAEKFRQPRDKDNFIIRRGMLRILLANYVGQSPSSLNFAVGTNGKPELQTHLSRDGVHFNLSQSGDLVLYSMTGACPVGVDVEFIQPIPQCERIAREFFSPAEAESLVALSEDLRVKRFYDLWTRKEALLKATGLGLGSGRMGRYISQAQSGLMSFDNLSQAFRMASGWYVRSLSPVAGYIAAVAFRKPNLDLICRGTPGFFTDEWNEYLAPGPRN